MLKILITGASGLLGSNLCKQYDKHNNIYGIFYTNMVSLPLTNLIQCNLTSSSQVQNLTRLAPDLIIHAAGEANVDNCEKNAILAKQSIVEATKNIVNLAKKTKAHLIYLSTDALFTGESEYYSELDNTSPINQYARLKIEAEEYIKNEYKKHNIIRTRFYGKSSRNNNLFFTEQIINKLKNEKEVYCFTDSYTTQINIETLGEIFLELFKRNIYGTFNIVEDMKLSRYEFAKIVADTYKLDSELIIPRSFKDIIWETQRPIDTSLSNKKIKNIINTLIPNTQEGLRKMKAT